MPYCREMGVELWKVVRVEKQGCHGRAEPSTGRAESRVGKMLVEAVAVRWPARVEGAALPGQGGGAVEGGSGGEAVVGQGREGGAEPSVGGAEARVGETLVEAVAARWPAKAEANCRAAMWVALERKRGMG